MRHSFLILGCVGAAGLAACAGPMSKFDDTTGADGGSVVKGDAAQQDSDSIESIPAETFGSGVTAKDADLFKLTPGDAAPFVFDPPSGVVLPQGWPSPDMLTHTSEKPALVRLELDYGSGKAAYTAFPELAPRSDPNGTDIGSWWTVRFPSSLFAKVRSAAPNGEIKWRVLHAFPGDTVPAGAESGTMRFLAGGDQPDVTYWQIAPSGMSGQFSVERLKVGAKSTKTLIPSPTGGTCIGCHMSSPDGQDVALNIFGNKGRVVDVLRPQANGQAVRSPIVSASGANLLDTSLLLIPSVSAGAWSTATGRWVAAAWPEQPNMVEGPFHIAVAQIDGPKAHLDVLAAADDAGSDILPAWSPDGTRIVFVHTSMATDGYLAASSYAPQKSDLWSVPITTAAGGRATFGAPTPIAFASGTSELETYPAFSPDGALLAYMRTPLGGGGYDETNGEIFALKADGSAAAVRIAANDAPADDAVWNGGRTSSWPRFGKPVITAVEGKYYPLIFSSRRGSGTLWNDKLRGNGRPFARLVYTVVLVKTDGTIQTFPGAIVPGQHAEAGSHCPDYVTITAVPPPGPN